MDNERNDDPDKGLFLATGALYSTTAATIDLEQQQQQQTSPDSRLT